MATSFEKHLDPSELGTKEYWDNSYARELTNYDEAAEDEGTIWFEESNAEETVLTLLNELAWKGLLKKATKGGHIGQGPPSRFLDLGTGNGHMLFSLAEEDDEGQSWTGEKIGLDYSEASIQLARRIKFQRESAGKCTPQNVIFEQWDLLESRPGDWLQAGFDVVLDKGTFDAISLMPQAESRPHPCTVYSRNVRALVKPGAFLCITSCNWSKEELLDWLVDGDEGGFEYFDQAKYPTFTFGGQTGQSVMTILLRRRSP